MSESATFQDAFNLLCGDKIGSGIHRDVFECKLRDDLVVKVENSEHRRFANVLEMEFWQQHQWHEPTAKWLAPCVFMSPDGRLLTQKRCERLPSGYPLPEKLPAFLTDHKTANYGIFEGRFVCFDYAMTIPAPSLRLRKVEWCVDV